MISSVILFGYLGENKERGFRIVKTNHYSLRNEKIIWYNIPCLYWSRDDRSYLNNLKIDAPVLIRGRIESDDERGLYVLVESVEVI